MVERRRAVLQFSVRADGARSADDVSADVERVLGCPLEEGEFNSIPAKVAPVLGMHVALYPWRGRDDRPVYRLETGVEPELFRVADDETLEMDVVDISSAVVEALRAYGSQDWYLPSAADITAEVEYGYEVDRAFQVSDDDISRWESGGF